MMRKTVGITISRALASGFFSSYALPFTFTGTINKLTFKLGPSQMSEFEQTVAAEAIKKARD